MCKVCDHNMDDIIRAIIDASGDYPDYCPFCGKSLSAKK